MKITREQGGQEFPPGSVVVRVPRSEFPIPFSKNSPYDEADDPYQRVKNYNLVIVASGVTNSRNSSFDRPDYSFVYSGASGRVYRWFEYHKGDYYEPGLPVGGPLVLVDCTPPKDHHNPPKAVNVYASTAGVVWLALRSLEPWVQNEVPSCLTEIDDAPFSAYLDKLEEVERLGPHKKQSLWTKLNLYFGLGD